MRLTVELGRHHSWNDIPSAVNLMVIMIAVLTRFTVVSSTGCNFIQTSVKEAAVKLQGHTDDAPLAI